MKRLIDDPEITEKLLLNAGFSVAAKGEGFLVSLKNRTITRGEVADVLACESEDLQFVSGSVLVR